MGMDVESSQSECSMEDYEGKVGGEGGSFMVTRGEEENISKERHIREDPVGEENKKPMDIDRWVHVVQGNTKGGA